VLISESSSSSEQARAAEAPRFALEPLIERRSASLQATLRF
jgi:hypothetical protein